MCSHLKSKPKRVLKAPSNSECQSGVDVSQSNADNDSNFITEQSDGHAVGDDGVSSIKTEKAIINNGHNRSIPTSSSTTTTGITTSFDLPTRSSQSENKAETSHSRKHKKRTKQSNVTDKSESNK